MNVKTGCFVDYDGRESRKSYECWDTTQGPTEVLEEIAFRANRGNSRRARKLRANLKSGNYQVVKLTLLADPVWR